MSEPEVLCEVNGVVVLARLSTGDLVAPEGLEGIVAYFESGGIPEKVYDQEHVGYRYRPANGAENVPRNRGGEWEYAPASDAEDMAVLAEKGWQVERLYRRVEDDE